MGKGKLVAEAGFITPMTIDQAITAGYTVPFECDGVDGFEVYVPGRSGTRWVPAGEMYPRRSAEVGTVESESCLAESPEKKDRVKCSPSLSEMIKESIAKGTVKDVKRIVMPPESLINSLMESIALVVNEPFTLETGSKSYAYSGSESVGICESHRFTEDDRETPAPEPVPTQTPPLGLTFGQAISALRLGLKVARNGWNGKGLWLELQVPDANSKMTLPYIFINYPATASSTPGARCPWLASQTDMLTDDWMVVY